ncbi:MAG: 3-deoxy-8-phosphooctulonate synthase [Rhodobacteraceae bacterium]|nr:3-deoxy-8-phosphooctulonate synthase [Paracoccaceae bacterium]
MKTVQVQGPSGVVEFCNTAPFTLIIGPCQIESRAHCLQLAKTLKSMCVDAGIPMIFKASFDKANRTSGDAPRGVGIEKGLDILAEVRSEVGVSVLSDVHEASQCARVAAVVDVLQTPAFLCRQTDLLRAAAATGKPVNIKKGQFLAPWDMAHVAEKLGDAPVMLTERGSSFGYNTLVNDFRALPIMAATGHPVIFDATHSVQQPGGQGAASGGQREFVDSLARAALAVGVAGLFIEAHDDPDNAPSDGPNMLSLSALPVLLQRWKTLDALTKG